MSGVDIFLAAICVNVTFCENYPPTVVQEENFYSFDLANPLSFGNIRNKTEILNALKVESNGRHFRIGTVQNYPLSYTITHKNGTVQGLGVSFDIIDLLQKKFNFTYEVVVPHDNQEGSIKHLENTLIGLLSRNEIDLAAAFLPVLADTANLIQYSTGLDEGEWLIMMKRPDESASGSGLLAPFDTNVWYLILVAVISFGPFIYMMTWLRYLMTKDKNNMPYKLSPCVWFVYGAFIKQGTTMAPDANTTRILFATWWIFITLLSAFYTANLTAFLTLSKFTLSINDPNDLVKKNNKWVARKGSAVEYVVTNPEEELYFLNKMVLKSQGMFQAGELDASFLPYVMSDFVFVRDKPAVELLMYEDYKNKTLQNVDEKKRCAFVVTQKKFMTKSRAFAFPKNSSLIRLFDPVILNLVESGIVKYKTTYELPANQICPLDLNSNERRLKNSDLQMTYVLAGIGIATATIVFVLEVFYRYWNRICINPFVTQARDENENYKMPKDFRKISPGPPPYQSIFGQPYGNMDTNDGKRKTINGRDYWVVQISGGDTRLIPVRTPSAFLFQYSS